MDFFNDLSRKVSSVAKSVTEKTKDGVEATKIASELHSAKGELNTLYTRLGEVCYNLRQGGGDPDEAERLYERIRATKNRIEELTAQRDDLRDVRRCPGCGSVQAKDARFCSSCGRRMPEDAPAPETDAPEGAEYCPDCGAQRMAEDRFCTVWRSPKTRPKRPRPRRLRSTPRSPGTASKNKRNRRIVIRKALPRDSEEYPCSSVPRRAPGGR